MEILGYVAPMTGVNETYVFTKWVEKRLGEGYSEERIALKQNAGGAKKCSKGTNQYGVKYDSCEYVQTVLAKLK